MELTAIQKSLLTILKNTGLQKDDIVTAMLLVKDSGLAMSELGMWISRNKITGTADILKRAIELKRKYRLG